MSIRVAGSSLAACRESLRAAVPRSAAVTAFEAARSVATAWGTEAVLGRTTAEKPALSLGLKVRPVSMVASGAAVTAEDLFQVLQKRTVGELSLYWTIR